MYRVALNLILEVGYKLKRARADRLAGNLTARSGLALSKEAQVGV
jgi:hypothetical protein